MTISHEQFVAIHKQNQKDQRNRGLGEFKRNELQRKYIATCFDFYRQERGQAGLDALAGVERVALNDETPADELHKLAVVFECLVIIGQCDRKTLDNLYRLPTEG